MNIGQFKKGQIPHNKGRRKPEHLRMINWKNKLPKCLVCEKKLSTITSQYCRAHFSQHPSYKRPRKPLSNEVREKIRQTRISRGNYPHTEEWKQKMRGKTPWNKGIKMGKDFSQKCGVAQKKRFETENPWNKGLTAKEVKTIRSGDQINTWKGGVTTVNEKIRKSTKYLEWRMGVLKRDDYICIFCKKRGGDLHADHIKQFALYPDLRFDLNNGRTLCVPCHRKTPTFGRLSKKKLHEKLLM